jgi:uroporphyrinogen decarboxylase
MNILHYRDVDRFPAVHFGYWSQLLDEWAEQGHITKELVEAHRKGNKDAKAEMNKIFGWDCGWSDGLAGTRNGLFPRFERKRLEVLPDGSHRIINGAGVIEKVKPGIVSIPSEDDYLLKDREAFETLYRPKMQFSPERINYEFFKNFNETRDPDIPVGRIYIAATDGETLYLKELNTGHFGKDCRDSCSVDNCHPNDLGFYRMAKTLEPLMKKLLKEN